MLRESLDENACKPQAIGCAVFIRRAHAAADDEWATAARSFAAPGGLLGAKQGADVPLSEACPSDAPSQRKEARAAVQPRRRRVHGRRGTAAEISGRARRGPTTAAMTTSAQQVERGFTFVSAHGEGAYLRGRWVQAFRQRCLLCAV